MMHRIATIEPEIRTTRSNGIEFYLQYDRQYVGNDVLWLAKAGRDRTANISEAQAYTKKVVRQNQNREANIPWSKTYVDAKTRHAVDMQSVDIEIALQDTDILSYVTEKPSRQNYKCDSCGRFVNEEEYYLRVYHVYCAKKETNHNAPKLVNTVYFVRSEAKYAPMPWISYVIVTFILLLWIHCGKSRR
jgi:transposase-like protein